MLPPMSAKLRRKTLVGVGPAVVDVGGLEEQDLIPFGGGKGHVKLLLRRGERGSKSCGDVQGDEGAAKPRKLGAVFYVLDLFVPLALGFLLLHDRVDQEGTVFAELERPEIGDVGENLPPAVVAEVVDDQVRSFSVLV